MIASPYLSAFRSLLRAPPLATPGHMPKVKRPKKGWFRPDRKKRKTGPAVKASEKGLPPCPACGQWSMQRDNSKSELYCGACGAIM